MAEEAGMTDFLSKPFTPDQLSSLLEKYISDQIAQGEDLDTSTYSDSLDKKFLIEAYGDDLDYAEEIFELFLSEYPKEMHQLITFIRDKNMKDLTHHVHKMKPTFQMVGLTTVSRRFQEIEAVSYTHLTLPTIYSV